MVSFRTDRGGQPHLAPASLAGRPERDDLGRPHRAREERPSDRAGGGPACARPRNEAPRAFIAGAGTTPSTNECPARPRAAASPFLVGPRSTWRTSRQRRDPLGEPPAESDDPARSRGLRVRSRAGAQDITLVDEPRFRTHKEPDEVGAGHRRNGTPIRPQSDPPRSPPSQDPTVLEPQGEPHAVPFRDAASARRPRVR